MNKTILPSLIAAVLFYWITSEENIRWLMAAVGFMLVAILSTPYARVGYVKHQIDELTKRISDLEARLDDMED